MLSCTRPWKSALWELYFRLFQVGERPGVSMACEGCCDAGDCCEQFGRRGVEAIEGSKRPAKESRVAEPSTEHLLPNCFEPIGPVLVERCRDVWANGRVCCCCCCWPSARRGVDVQRMMPTEVIVARRGAIWPTAYSLGGGHLAPGAVSCAPLSSSVGLAREGGTSAAPPGAAPAEARRGAPFESARPSPAGGVRTFAVASK
mmetsp:Transcript_98120/g.316087  ORF Transcript_98120/g.316087 Transcript_98120/m.316087 type:complete len:202 (-) Transcript_98120:1340-1945(-)